MKGKHSRAAFVDRDGTIVVERRYLSDAAQVELLPGAAQGLRQLKEIGLALVVVTNQAAIGRGLFDQLCLDRIHQRMCDLLEAKGVSLDGIYCCPHPPEAGCACRKPRTGLIEQAAQELGVLPGASFVIGDNACDIELGQRIGATTFLVRSGYGAQVAAQAAVPPDYVVDGLPEVAQVIQGLLARAEV